MTYTEFIQSKKPLAQLNGFMPATEPHESLKPHQRDIAKWMVRGGRRAGFLAFGLGKTRIHLQVAKWICEHEQCLTCKDAALSGVLVDHSCCKRKYLIIAPLGVRYVFIQEEGPAIGIEVTYCRTDAEVAACQTQIVITNYERVRDGGIKVTPEIFSGVGLDEASVLRSFGSKTYQSFLTMFSAIDYRFVFTATPSPNRHKELIHYAGFLGIMDTGQALTRFFKRDSQKAGNLTLMPSMESEFWDWLSSWSCFMQAPSDLGFSDDGYSLPPIEVHWHRVSVDHKKAWDMIDSWGQRQLILDKSAGLKELAGVKRETMICRVEKAVEIIKGLIESADGQEKIHVGMVPEKQSQGKSQQSQVVSIQSQIQRGQGKKVEAKKSRAKPSASQIILAEKSAQTLNEKQRVVSEKQTASCDMGADCKAEAIRPDIDSIQLNVEVAGRKMCDLPAVVSGQEGSKESPYRSLPFDKQCQGTAMRPVQFSIGDDAGQSETAHTSSGLSDQIIIWADLNDEQKLAEKVIEKMGFSVTSLTGSQNPDTREKLLMEWLGKKTSVFLSKPTMYGAGCNLQQSHTMIFLGTSYKFYDFIQACHRVQRFQQQHQVNIHIIFSESEDAVISSLKKKWAQHDALVAHMSELLKKYQLDLETMQIIRKTGCARVEISSDKFRAINNDCVLELDANAMEHKAWDGETVDMIVTSIPFGNQYEYSANYHDMGYNQDNNAFFAQLDYLVPNLLRVLKPGRLACIHVKDRIRFGGQHGTGVPTVDRFSDKTADLFERHGFFFLGRITIDTDVVRENAQTYRLGWSENAKDSTKMGVGMQEYVLLFRKPQTERAQAYADVPVTKNKEVYLRADWQVDAAGFWKSDGNRLPDPDILANMPMDAVRRLWIKHAHDNIYSHAEHVQLATELENRGYLPSSWMLFAPISNNPGIWTDIVRMRVLNSKQDKQRKEKHVCPLQIDICNRLIGRYSNPGEVVLDPFAGIFSVPYCAIHMGRIGCGIELAHEYWKSGVGYCEQAERERNMPTLFDLVNANVPVIETEPEVTNAD